MRRILAIMTLVFTTVFSSVASQKDSLWNTAVNRYLNSEFESALEDFLALEEQGYASAELFYNIGNCYYKSDHQLGKVILYYERALKYDPSFEDAKFNISIASQAALDKIDEVPEFILVTWAKDIRDIMGSNAWMLMAMVLFVVTVMCILIFRFAGRIVTRKFAFSIAVIFLFFAIISFLFAFSSRKQVLRTDEAVIMVPVTSVKGSPGMNDYSLFILHEGTVVEIIDEVGEWKRIEIADGRQGWVEVKNIEII